MLRQCEEFIAALVGNAYRFSLCAHDLFGLIFDLSVKGKEMGKGPNVQ